MSRIPKYWNKEVSTNIYCMNFCVWSHTQTTSCIYWKKMLLHTPLLTITKGLLLHSRAPWMRTSSGLPSLSRPWRRHTVISQPPNCIVTSLIAATSTCNHPSRIGHHVINNNVQTHPSTSLWPFPHLSAPQFIKKLSRSKVPSENSIDHPMSGSMEWL